MKEKRANDEFKDFDPRAFWAEVNHDEAYTPAFRETKKLYNYRKIKPQEQFLKSKHGQVWTFLFEPRSILEISEQIQVDHALVKYILEELETIYQAKILKIKENKRSLYIIRDRVIKKLKLT